MAEFTELIAVAIPTPRGGRSWRPPAPASSRRPTRRGAGSSATCTTPPSSGSCRSGSELRAAEAALPAELSDVKQWIASAAAGTAEILEEVQEISRGIHPAILTTGGLAPALRTLARRSAVPVELRRGDRPDGCRRPSRRRCTSSSPRRSRTPPSMRSASLVSVAVDGAQRRGRARDRRRRRRRRRPCARLRAHRAARSRRGARRLDRHREPRRGRDRAAGRGSRSSSGSHDERRACA